MDLIKQICFSKPIGFSNRRDQNMKRRCGVLLPVASLPGRYGIGCFSRDAYDFMDFLQEAGQTYWQILPLGQTGYGDSPYQSFSTFAGNPYFIDLQEFIDRGYITAEEADECDFGDDPRYVDYEKIYFQRYPLLWKAYENSPFALYVKDKWKDSRFDADRAGFEAFILRAADWLPDYALYCAIKKYFKGKSFIEWDDDIRLRRPAVLEEYRQRLADSIRFYEFQQYFFDLQWHKLKKYANDRGIRIIGDIPIYVAFDSADTWSHPELFQLDERGYPTDVAGVPPDAFSATGQLWGNPLYRWDYNKETGYAWWISRLRQCFSLYDVVRIDHFRGFDEYYAVPFGESTAMNGEWRPGPGMDLFDAMKKALGKRDVIAEDLGLLTDSVIRMVKKSGFPGMKVLEFAFDGKSSNAYLPHNYVRNCIAYTGTHDNQTLRGWYDGLGRKGKKIVRRYSGTSARAKNPEKQLIRMLFMSVADTVIVPIQDYLGLGDEARINTPSTLGGNWQWRLLPGELTGELGGKMREMAEVYGRVSR